MITKTYMLPLARLALCPVNSFYKQILAVVCITLLGCIYIQQTFSPSQQLYATFAETTSGCQPHSNIVFIKAHKCASSTVQNIFLRYGYFHNKVFVLPPKGNYLGHPKTFNRNMVPSKSLYHGGYNILTHHSRMNYDEMRLLMPNDTLFLTIVRNPVQLFESMYHYYKLNKFWKVEFDIFNSDNSQIPEKVNKSRFVNRIGINQIMFDMGFEPEHFNNENKIKEYIHKLDSIFALVMIAERMEESLILMKHLLCWNYTDIIAFKVNARSQAFKHNVTEVGARRIRELNKADQMLYEHFSKKFDQQVKTFGEAQMQDEVNKLREETKQYYSLCVQKAVTGANSPVVRFVNQKEDNFVCKFLTYSELQLTNFIREEQLQNHPFSVLSINATAKLSRS